MYKMSFKVIKEFENEIANFFGSPYAVAVDCCTHSIELCLRYNKVNKFTIPRRTYLSVAFLGKKLDIDWDWKDEKWIDYYYLGGTNIIDAAVLWKANSYIPNTFMCLSFQFQKHLSLGRGGMILTDDNNAREALKRMSYDGRNTEIPWREQNINSIGYHYYMTPETAKTGLKKLPEAIKTKPKKWVIEDWPDLKEMDIFK
jgi:dTDP-4-amino-4,6-dideoxygalactose transaminase|tara:strand:+ start:168 stop:767 length:600 start_codon:yes stop_codon:yes gene_type:complete